TCTALGRVGSIPVRETQRRSMPSPLTRLHSRRAETGGTTMESRISAPSTAAASPSSRATSRSARRRRPRTGVRLEPAVAAVDEERVAGMVGARVGHQVDRDAAEILRRAPALYRDARHHGGGEL